MANLEVDGSTTVSTLTILAFATEWDSGHGGLSTLNRELCCALAALGHTVYCAMPAYSNTEYELARSRGVTLVMPRQAPGIADQSLLFRQLPIAHHQIDVVIGHGRITGPQASAQRDDYFPSARYVHFIHMDPCAIEWHKSHEKGSATEISKERLEWELELCRIATIVAAVGPLLRDWFSTYLHNQCITVHEFLPGLFEGQANSGPPLAFNCLLFGRAEDAELKGIPLAAKAMCAVSANIDAPNMRLRVLGAPPDKGDDLRRELKALSGGCDVHIEPYTSNRAEVLQSIRIASLVLMPSTVEGFGLSGLEAISEGIPVLLTRKSGLAQAISQRCHDIAHHCQFDAEKGEIELANRIQQVLADPDAAFERAKRLREAMQEEFDWLRAAKALVTALDKSMSGPVPPSQTSTLSSTATDTSMALRAVLRNTSAPILKWQQTLRLNDQWLHRAELEQILEYLDRDDGSCIVLLGSPGSGKSALLSRLAGELAESEAFVLAIKADRLSSEVKTERHLIDELGLSERVDSILSACSRLGKAVLIVDQLDAIADLVDTRTERLSLILDVVKRTSEIPGVRVVMSCRELDFGHDIRFKQLQADVVGLQLPPVEVVKNVLITAGADVTVFTDSLLDLLRNPQCLDVFLEVDSLDRNANAFESYQLMLEQLWRKRLEGRPDAETLYSNLEETAILMADREELWVARSTLPYHISETVGTLVSLGFLLNQGERVAYAHQSYFEFARAKAYLSGKESLADNTIQRQDSLSIRPTLWTCLAYLRATSKSRYLLELEVLWKYWTDGTLRYHVRALLIQFLGGLGDPEEREKAILLTLLSEEDWVAVVVDAITGQKAWFAALLPAHLPPLMSGKFAAAAVTLLARATEFSNENVVQALERYWVPYADKQRLVSFVLMQATLWSESMVEISVNLLAHGSFESAFIDGVVNAAIGAFPKLAPALIAARIERCLREIESKPESSSHEDETTNLERAIRRREICAPYDGLLRTAGGIHCIDAAAEAAPREFLEHVWPLFLRTLRCARQEEFNVQVYPSEPLLGSLASSEELGYALPAALVTALTAIATIDPAYVESFVTKWKSSESLSVQQFMVILLVASLPHSRVVALEYLLGDPRRLAVGDFQDSIRYSENLVTELGKCLSTDEAKRLEARISEWRSAKENEPDIAADIRDYYESTHRRYQRRLLDALNAGRAQDQERVPPSEEERDSSKSVTSRHHSLAIANVIGSPVSTEELLASSDDEILRLFDMLPDTTNWEHPQRFMEGGSIQASQAFAEAVKRSPDRFGSLLRQFKPGMTERPVATSLRVFADVIERDKLELIVLDLVERGFSSPQFRSDVAYALETAFHGKGKMSSDICAMLESWLTDCEVPPPGKVEETRTSNDTILFGMYDGLSFPGGNFPFLLALGTNCLSGTEPDLDAWCDILEKHLNRTEDPEVWKALSQYLDFTLRRAPKRMEQILERLFERYFVVLDSKTGAALLARAMHFCPEETIERWSLSMLNGSWSRKEQAYGELLVLAATKAPPVTWAVRCLNDELARWEGGSANSGLTLLGIAHSASHLWPLPDRRAATTDILLKLLPNSTGEQAEAIVAALGREDALIADTYTRKVLRALVQHPMILAHSHRGRLVESLKALLPAEANIVFDVVSAIVGARAGTGDDPLFISDGPDLVDISMTLQRLGSSHRENGLTLFESLLKSNAYGARDLLNQIDPVSQNRGTPRRPIRSRSSRRTRPNRHSIRTLPS